MARVLSKKYSGTKSKLKRKTEDNRDKSKTIDEAVQRYLELSKIIKEFSAEKDNIAKQLKDLAIENGTKDDKGSYYAYTTDGSFCYANVCVAPVPKLNKPKALAYLQDKGFTQCIKTVQDVDEKELEKLLAAKRISISDFEGMCDVGKPSHRILVSDTETLKKNSEKFSSGGTDKLPEAEMSTRTQAPKRGRV